MRFRFDPLSRVFSNFKIDVFSMKTLGREVWTEGMTHRNVCVFKRKPILVDGALELQPMIL